MELEIICGCAVLFCLAVIVYRTAFLEETQKDEPLKISAAGLGVEIANNHGSFQDRYYLRVLAVNGKISDIKIIPSPNNDNKQHIILDGEICCEFSEVMDNLHKGMSVEIKGLCMGKILTGCEVIGP